MGSNVGTPGRFKAGQPLEDGALRVLEQLPGISHQVWVGLLGMGGREMGVISTFGEEGGS